ncbi:MAG TPA: hypothetical protein VLH79_13585 [Chthonomonadales bacterium]|nr:hypothetical protein [Chthonomonadales bacterium]
MSGGWRRRAGTRGVVLAAASLGAAVTLPGWTSAPAAPAAAPPARQAGAAGRPAEEPRRLRIEAAEMVHNDKTGEGEARQVVVVDPEGAVVRADLWRWNDRVRVGRASGNLKITDPDLEATADEAEVYYDRSRKLVVLIGRVVITVKAREGEAAPPGGAQPAAASVANGQASVDADRGRPQIRRYPVVLRAARAEYFYARDRRRGTLSGGVDVVQTMSDNERRLTAPSAEWFGLEDRLVLKGPVRFEDRRGRRAETEQDVEVLTREGAEGIRMRQSRFWVPVDDEPAPTGTPASGGQPSGAGAGGDGAAPLPRGPAPN